MTILYTHSCSKSNMCVGTNTKLLKSNSEIFYRSHQTNVSIFSTYMERFDAKRIGIILPKTSQNWITLRDIQNKNKQQKEISWKDLFRWSILPKYVLILTRVYSYLFMQHTYLTYVRTYLWFIHSISGKFNGLKRVSQTRNYSSMTYVKTIVCWLKNVTY